MPDTSGPTSLTPLAFYDPGSSSWRMSQGTFLSDSTSSSLTLPASGMTRGGALYALPMSGPATAAPDSSCLPTPRVAADRSSRASLIRQGHWSAPSLGQAVELAQGILPREYENWDEVQGRHRPLLRTPQAAVVEAKPEGIKLSGRTPVDPQVGLADQVRALLPTPMTAYTATTVEEWKERRPAGNGQRRETVGDLGLVVGALLPTPVAHDDGKSPEAHMAMKRRMKGGERDQITSLSVMARQASATGEWDPKLLPTPLSRDSKVGYAPGGAPPNRQGPPPLNDVVRTLLPTPSAADGLGGHERRGGDRGDELLLAGLVKDVTLLPPPTTQPATGNGHARNLGREARMLPTPRTSDANGAGEHGGGGPDLRTTVGRMPGRSGATTAPPSPDTPPPSADPHPTLWTHEDG